MPLNQGACIGLSVTPSLLDTGKTYGVVTITLSLPMAMSYSDAGEYLGNCEGNGIDTCIDEHQALFWPLIQSLDAVL